MATRDELEIEQIRATISKLNADTAKLQTESRYPPVIVAALIIGVISPVALATIAIFAN
ncbi:MAG: hypothetical protein AAF618_08870 [Pseudomonadota bacterium]